MTCLPYSKVMFPLLAVACCAYGCSDRKYEDQYTAVASAPDSLDQAQELERAESSFEQDRELLTTASKSLTRIEMIVYTGGPSASRIGPICINDVQSIVDMRGFLEGLRDVRPMNSRHASFTDDEQIYLTLVFDEIAQVRARVIGPFFIFCDQEEAIGILPLKEFHTFISARVSQFTMTHPDDVITVRN